MPSNSPKSEIPEGEKGTRGLDPSAASSSVNSELPGLIDTHCHLEMAPFDEDREEVISRARAAGLEAMITVGSDLRGTMGGMELAEKYDFIYSSVGIHPHDSKDFNDEIFARLKEWAARKKVVAIGETGLDFHYDHSPRDVQRDVFRRHLQLARETDLPVIIHSREASEETLAIMEESGVNRGVLHCFSGDREMAERAIAMGFSISFAGPLTFAKADALRAVARVVPDDYILAETDAPYLAPVPYRGKRNEPANMVSTIRKLAEVRGVSFEDMARITTLNAKRLFGIGIVSEEAEIAYLIRDSLYLNITNRCSNVCSFCVKFRSDFVKGHRLKLGHEPSVEEIEEAIGDPSQYKEVVFCGYGEPLQRLETVKRVASWVKERKGIVRINTNGHADLINKRKTLPELKGLVDRISVSLDAQDEETYDRICRPKYKGAFDAVLQFIRESREVIPEVQATVVEIDGVDVERCRQIARELGVTLRVRKLDVVG